jgi:DNA-binding LacI/PurR family transcriptional regulator
MGRKQSGEDGGKRRATMTRVAEELGVSAMTVSNAYNHPERLSAALRERIFEAAKRLGYPGPNPLGRGLRSGRAGALGVIYDNLLSYAFEDQAAVSFLRGVSAAAEEEGLGLTLVPATSRGERNASAIGRTLVDGFVVYSVADGDPVLEAALERGLPAVTVDQPGVEGVPFVGIDDEAAARAAAEHLVELGHRRYAVVTFGLAPDWREGIANEERQRSSSYRVSRSRLEGYAVALAAGDIPWSEVPVYECPSSSKALGHDAAEVVLSRVPRPTAVLATSDELALGVIEAARERGLSVPSGLSVVGFDDVREAAIVTPPLTTVRQDHAEKGLSAGRLLVAQLRGKEASSPGLLPAQLVVRGSTARAPEGR